MTKPPAQQTVIHCGDLEIDRERYFVHLAGRRVQLTYMEFHVLAQIAEGEGRIVAYDELARSFWGAPSTRTQRRLAVLMSRIRSKLGAGCHYIDTVHRVGYRLRATEGAEPA